MVHEHSGNVRVGRELSSLRVHGGSRARYTAGRGPSSLLRCSCPGDKYRIYPCQDLSYSVGSEASEVPREKPKALLRLCVPSRNLAPRL